MFGNVLASLSELALQCLSFNVESIYQVLDGLGLGYHNEIYRQMGAVYGYVLYSGDKVEFFVGDVEDIMLLMLYPLDVVQNITDDGKVYYTRRPFDF